MSDTTPALSVVLSTGHGWEEAEPTLRTILAADPPGGMEVIFCDGSGDGPLPLDDPRLSKIDVPGASVFDLRARGVAAARGAIVAITEDHCMPDADWPDEVLAAHARHPEAVAVAGGVDNGPSADAWDWANFLLTFAEHMPPVDSAPARRAPSVANGSFKRALVDMPDEPAPGWLELELMPELVAAGAVVRDDGPRVVHDQVHDSGFETLSVHFHNGRASAGLRADPPGIAAVRAEWRRLVGLPLRLTRELRDARAVRPPLEGQAKAGARLVPLLAVTHAIGETAGLLAGPGNSAEQLE